MNASCSGPLPTHDGPESMMKRPILLYLSPFVPVLTELANEAGRCLIENRFAELLLGTSQFSSLVLQHRRARLSRSQ